MIDEYSADFADELPEGWCVARLRDVAYARLGKTPRRKDYRNEGPHRIVKFRDIRNGRVEFGDPKAGFVVDEVEVLNTLRPVRAGDTLITASAHSGDNIGKKCAFVDQLTEQTDTLFFVGELLGITPVGDVMVNKWPHFWFCSERGLRALQDAVAGVHLTSGRAQDISLPLAPLAEQQRIVAKIEELLARASAAREHLDRVPAILKRFRQTVLAAACSGRLTGDWGQENPNAEPPKTASASGDELQYNDEFAELPETWRLAILGSLLQPGRQISYGVLKPGKHDPGGVRLIKSQQVRDGVMDLSEDFRISRRLDKEYARTRLQGGEVLLNLVGASIGRSAIAPADLRGANVSRAIAVIPVVHEIAPWVQLNLRGPVGQRLIHSKTGGSAQPVLNLSAVRALAIPVPSFDEQRQCVRRVERLLALADQIEMRYATAKARIESFTRSILAKAFRGELVPTEAELARLERRVYEPASVLLDRIRAQCLKSETKLTGTQSFRRVPVS